MRNSVTLVGRPGAEPEVRIFGNNNKKARFSLAVTERKRNANNEWVSDTQWFPIVAWGKTAERVENNEWTDDKGNRHSITEVWVNDLLLMDKAKD